MKRESEKRRIKSKKGMTLVELLIGVTLVVIVFASTLGAMVGGFTTTVYNSDENKAAVLNASLNEVIMNAVRNLKFPDNATVNDEIDSIETNNVADSTIVAAVKESVPEAEYVKATKDATGKYTVTFKENVSYQYTLIPETKTTLKVDSDTTHDVNVDGVTIKTCFDSASGPIVYETFVPYKK